MSDEDQAGVERDAGWLAGALERDLHGPFELYAGQVRASRERVAAQLGVAPDFLEA